MDAYENMIDIIGKYHKNHYKSLELQQKVNSHISGLKVTAKKMKGTSVGVICSKEASRYERLLSLAISRKI